MRSAQFLLTAVVLAGSIGVASAQSTAGAGSVLVVPVVALTTSYETEVTVRNPNSAPITVNVKFYEANNSPSPGLHACSQLTVAALESKPFTLSTQCGLATPPPSHFGMLVLEDAAAQQTNVFFAYSRAQTPGGNGFSIEGFPIGAFSAQPADVVGLKRQAAAPIYQSNCFVSALSEAVSYQIILRDGTTNAPIGSPITNTLQPFQQIRYLDIFSNPPNGVGAPAGDYANVRANFTVTGGATLGDGARPALIGFCTVQESTFFGADFRIAKSMDALNEGQKRLACIGQASCGVGNPPSPFPLAERIADPTLRNVYSMIITQPDFVRCDLAAASGDLPNLQMRLRVPGDPFTSAVFATSPPYDSGGANKTTFYIYTGGRAAVNNGVATRWFVDVETISSSTTVPIDFAITCSSGNGTEVPWFRGTGAWATF